MKFAQRAAQSSVHRSKQISLLASLFSPHRFVKASLMGGFFMAVRKYREDDHGEFALPKAHHLHC